MKEKISSAIIDSLVEAINARDLNALDEIFTEDVIIEWPQSGERILGGENRRAVYSRFPSLPKVTPKRITGSGNFRVLEAALDYGNGDQYLSVFIFEIRNNRIVKEIAYWSKPFPAPEWRTPWVEHQSF